MMLNVLLPQDDDTSQQLEDETRVLQVPRHRNKWFDLDRLARVQSVLTVRCAVSTILSRRGGTFKST